MSKTWWCAILAVVMCAAPAMAQAPQGAVPRDVKAPPAAAGTGEEDLQTFAALDSEDQDLFAAELGPGGPHEAPMGDAGWSMAGMHGRRHPGGPMDGGPGGMRGPQRMRAHMMMMAEELELTDAQREKIHGIMDQQMRRGIQERADIQIATFDLHQLMRADQPNKTSIDAQVDKLARLRATLAKERIGSLLQAHALLTPEQKTKLRQRHMGGGMHGPHGEDDGAGPQGQGRH
jgi:Spy/CpxP family protein refolding chaperone